MSSEALYRSLLGRLVRPIGDRVFDPACPRWQLKVAPALASTRRAGGAENAPEDIAPEGGPRPRGEENPE